MPETRYHTITKYPDGLSGKDKTLDKAVIIQEPYEVSDEQLADETEVKEVQLIIENLPDVGINKAWKRLIKKGLLP